MSQLQWNIFLSIMISALIVHAIVSDIVLFSLRNNLQEQERTTPVTPTPSPSVAPTTAPLASSQPVSLPKESDQPTIGSKASVTLPSEYFIPLGTGSTTKTDWEDIYGAETIIDTAQYPNIKKVTFEVSLSIPTKNGKVSARLYNVTDKHPVWFSEVATESDTPAFLQSPTITLDRGNKLYRVQMKTSLGYSSVLTTSRIRIRL